MRTCVNPRITRVTCVNASKRQRQRVRPTRIRSMTRRLVSETWSGRIIGERIRALLMKGMLPIGYGICQHSEFLN